MDMGGGLFAVNQCDDMRMMEAFEDGYLGGKVVPKLLVQLDQIDGFDSDNGLNILGALLRRQTCSLLGFSMLCGRTYRMNCLVDGCEAAAADFLLTLEGTYPLRLS